MPILMRIIPAVRFISTDFSIALLTISSGAALYRSRREPWTALFVVSAYLNLSALLVCLRQLDVVPRGDLRRRWPLELAVLVLGATLNTTFCYQVSKWMPPAVSVALWLLAAAVSVGGSFIFCGRHRPRANRAPGAR